MNDARSHSSLLVPPSTQDWMQGVLSAKVVLVMYEDYQDSRSADVYKLIKAIKRELRAVFGEDYLCFIFRDDLPRIDVPTLIIHGDSDRILSLESTAAKLPKLIENSQLVVIPGGPHAINWTHADRVNPVLLDFLQQE